MESRQLADGNIKFTDEATQVFADVLGQQCVNDAGQRGFRVGSEVDCTLCTAGRLCLSTTQLHPP